MSGKGRNKAILQRGYEAWIMGGVKDEWMDTACQIFAAGTPYSRHPAEVLLPLLEAQAGITGPICKAYHHPLYRIVKCVIKLCPKYGLPIPGLDAKTFFPRQAIRNILTLSGVQIRPEVVEIAEETIRRFYISYEWRRLRYWVLLTYGRKCLCCGDTTLPLHVDHIKPLRKHWELRLDPKNLQVLCEACNHGKGNWDQTDWRPEIKELVMDEEEALAAKNHQAAGQLRMQRRLAKQPVCLNHE